MAEGLISMAIYVGIGMALQQYTLQCLYCITTRVQVPCSMLGQRSLGIMYVQLGIGMMLCW